MLPNLETSVSNSVQSIIEHLRDESCLFQKLYVVKEGDPLEKFFFWHLVEDKANFQGGTFTYAEFIQEVQRSSMGMTGAM